MTQLSDFNPEERELLVSLPYKVGLWVSHAEDEEGEDDDELEKRALEQCLEAVAEAAQETRPFVYSIVSETLARRNDWGDWSDAVFHTDRTVSKVAGMLREKGLVKDMKILHAALNEIATAVAQAYGEFGQFGDDAEPGFFKKLIDKIRKAEDSGHPMNVSPAEDSLIAHLAAAFKV